MWENTPEHWECIVEIPDEVKKWNWGAFWLTWIWGIGNRSYIALLALIPIVNLIMPFYLGKKGNELAWRNKDWYNLQLFHRTQKNWAIAGWIIGLLYISITVGKEVVKYQNIKEAYEITNNAMEIVMDNKGAKELIGEEYEIVHNIPMGVGDAYERSIFGYSMRIKSDNKNYSVYVKMGEAKEIKSIEVSDFGDNGKPKNNILIELDN